MWQSLLLVASLVVAHGDVHGGVSWNKAAAWGGDTGNGEQVIMAKIYYPDGDNSGPTKIVDGHDKHVDNHDDHHDGDHDNDHHGDHQDDHHNDHDDDHDDHHNDHADDHDDHSDSHVNCDHDKGKDKLMMVLMPTEKKQKSDNDQLNPLDNNKVVNIAEKWNKMEKMADMMMTYMGYRKAKDDFMSGMKAFCYLANLTRTMTSHNFSMLHMHRDVKLSDRLEEVLSTDFRYPDMAGLQNMAAHDMDAFADAAMGSVMGLCRRADLFMEHTNRLSKMKKELGVEPTTYDMGM